MKVGLLHPKLLAHLVSREVTPVANNPLWPGFSDNEWELRATDGKRYIIALHEGELHILSPDKSLFVYGMLRAGSGGGVIVGPIEFTAIAWLRLNRRFESQAEKVPNSARQIGG